MAVSRGLGKGLAALFSEIENESVTSYDNQGNLNNGVQEIAIKLIDSDNNQPRKNFDEESLFELSESIKSHGVIIPIIVIKNKARYTIVAGERRFRASKIAGLDKIPAIIRNYTERERKEIALIENIQREDLNSIEEALAYKSLIEECKITQDELAKVLGKSRPAITNCIRLLNLCPEVQAMVVDRKISSGHARCLVVVKDREIQLRLAQNVIERKISVMELQSIVNNILLGNKFEVKEKKNFVITDTMKAVKSDLRKLFKTKVSIKGDEEKGKISINYNSKETLDNIISILQQIKE